VFVEESSGVAKCGEPRDIHFADGMYLRDFKKIHPLELCAESGVRFMLPICRDLLICVQYDGKR
jgi:hypothetical protein